MEKELETKETIVTGTEVDEPNIDYLAAIKELKQNSVNRSEYDKLKAENKKLLNEVLNGQPAQEESEQVEVIPTKEEIQRLREDLFNPKRDLSNLEYVTKAIDLRDALIQNGEPDPFLPFGKQINPTSEDIASVERAVQVYKECVEYARGDSEAFTNELMRRTRDVRLNIKR